MTGDEMLKELEEICIHSTYKNIAFRKNALLGYLNNLMKIHCDGDDCNKRTEYHFCYKHMRILYDYVMEE